MDILNQISDVAQAAARRAGAIQKEKYGGILNVDKRLRNDLKLEADRLCEAAIIGTIKETFPGHAIVAEESGRAEGDGYVWYVDPLDGTVNFYFGLPYFCTTLACYRQSGAPDGTLAGLGEPLVGVTYATLLDEMFVGVAGKGATLNGRAIAVREEDSLAEAMLITAIGTYDDKAVFARERMLPLGQRVTKMRNLGACAYDLANVATGRASGFFEYGVNEWDLAAGRILVEAAGGRFDAWRLDNGKWFIIGTGKNIFDEVASALRD